MKKLILKCALSPGDVVTLTAAVRDLHRAYPGEYITDIRTPCAALWENNHYITRIDDDDPDARVIAMEYPLIHRSNQEPVHFITAYTAFLAEQIGRPIRSTAFRGDIHLSNDERGWISQVEEIEGTGTRFWIIVSGGKTDFTAKWWDAERWQSVVDHFAGRIRFVQVGEAGHKHPPLRGVLDLRGKTDMRQLVRLMYHADGVLCPVTSLMHLAAAVPWKHSGGLRPCVVVAGGREPSHWERYPGHVFLDTIGQLPCCDIGGCWKSRVVPLGDGDEKDKSLCERPVKVRGGVYLPACLDRITAADVIRAVDGYLAAVPEKADIKPKKSGCCGAISNAVSAAARVASAISKGNDIQVPPDLRKRRLEACIKCENLIRGGVLLPSMCSLCSCVVGLKTALATEDCPIGKWENKSAVSQSNKHENEKSMDDIQKDNPASSELRVKFHHGLGDHAHFAANIVLAREDGYSVIVESGADKHPILLAAGAKAVCQGGYSEVGWHDPYWGRDVSREVPIWEYNKSAVNLSAHPMPKLRGSVAEQWQRFRRVRLSTDSIPEEKKQRVESLIESLPRPIILMHTCGNSWQEVKKLPHSVVEEACDVILDNTAGSLVLLDWDNRTPRTPSWRVRHSQDDWGGLCLSELMYLTTRADLLVGVDSGPLHTAGIMGCPTVAVWPNHEVKFSKYLVPRDNQVSLVSSTLHEWCQSVRDTFNVIEYQGDITGRAIGDAALSMLNPRYLDGRHSGADAMLQHWIRDWQRTSASPLTRRGDRDLGFDYVLREMRNRMNPIAVETGCARMMDDWGPWGGAGFSTYLLGVYMKFSGGKLVSMDISPDNCALARAATSHLGSVDVRCVDSVLGLSKWSGPIDLLLLDSWDTSIAGFAEHALREVKAVESQLCRKTIIVFDDTVYSSGRWAGKGALAVPYLIGRGWRIAYSGLQTILRLP